MLKLDDLLKTNTHFHETQKYEERLDSQTVLKYIKGNGNLNVEKTNYEAESF